MRNTAVTVDLDSTIADTRHRKHLLEGEYARNEDGTSEKWIRYAEACIDDTPIEATVTLVRALSANYQIFFVSGRHIQGLPQTIAWLQKHDIPFDGIALRTDDDPWKDGQGYYKWIKIKFIEATHDVDVELHIDDWGTVKDYLEPKGIPVLHVVPPGFTVTETTEEFA